MLSPSIFTSVIDGYLPHPHASLLNGIIFGSMIKDPEFYIKLKRVGLLHIVVLSGMNITILASIISSLTSWIPKKASILVSIFCIIFFVLFVGPKPPIVRAACMGILTLLAIATGRKALPLYLLFLSGIAVAIIRPEWIRGISFQLSYAATAAILLAGSPTPPSSTKRFAQFRYFLAKESRPAVAAYLAATPILFLYFREVSLLSPISTLLVSFVIAPLMVFGLLTSLLGFFHPFLGLIPAWISTLLTSWIVWIVDVLNSIPFTYLTFTNGG